ncbi:Cupin domain-containing protein [Desulfurella multipotens]|uniref:Cupin domain-containing protein n=1 Tax=Desulfurella multipotens TaxID=79269 RepID=A0A1G6N9K5_9BACT|nr:cupin domain-containing protein [Desulfurella multipotens]SDC64057.1 Cupin domain-containing protein [Desulfurella multipotens]
MKVIFFESAKNYEPQKDWKRVSLCDQKSISIEYFIKPPFHASPEHAHENAQVLVVLKGKMSVKNKDREVILSQNDCVFIEPNEPHVVKNLLNEASVGLDIFVPGRDFSFWLNKL